MNDPEFIKPKKQKKILNNLIIKVKKFAKKQFLKIKIRNLNKLHKVKLKNSKVDATKFNIKSIQFYIEKAITEKSLFVNDSLSKKRPRKTIEPMSIFERFEKELCSLSKDENKETNINDITYDYNPVINFLEQVQNFTNSLKYFVEYLKFNIVSIGM